MDPLGLFFLWSILHGSGAAEPEPAPLPFKRGMGEKSPTVPGPMPVAAPTGDLPPFPGPGWEADEPPPPEVVARAWELLPSLWATGVGATRIDLTGGRWIGYVARWHAGPSGPNTLKGVEAFRVKGSGAVLAPMVVNVPPAAPQAPSPVVPVGPKPAAPTAPGPTVYVPPASPTPVAPAGGGTPYGGTMTVAQVQSAVNALGYKPALAVDGKLGPLSIAGVKWAQRTLNARGWSPALAVDGKPGPLTQAALRTQGVPAPSPAVAPLPASTPPVTVPPSPTHTYGATWTNAQLQQAVNAMGYTPPLVVDGKLGPLSTAGVKWAQRTVNAAGYTPALVVDGKPGPLTQAGIQDYQAHRS